MTASALDSELARDVREGLSASPKWVPPKYLYDDLGSALFEAICLLPWYRITRAETALLSAVAPEVARRFTRSPFIVELGPGSGEKLLRLATGFAATPRRAHLHLIDISSSALATAQQALARLEGFTVTEARTTYHAGLKGLAAIRPEGAPMLTLMLGSNIGNLSWEEGVRLLGRIRQAGVAGDSLLLGTDLVKPEADLQLAYDDPLGVTAAFNKNLLVRLNRDLAADFDLAAFDHRAVWNAALSRMEMHLVSRRAQRVSIPGAGLAVDLEAGESIWTEGSAKYTLEAVARLAAEAGFEPRQQWTDQRSGFALTLFQAQ